MQKVAIVTDTGADLPQDLAEELAIQVAPLHVIIQGRDYRDKVDMSGAKFYRLLPGLDPLPTTSAVTIHDFVACYRAGLEVARSVLCLPLAEEFSATMSAALQAKGQMPEVDITVMDTRTGLASQALLAIAAARAARAGASKEEVIALVEELIPRVDQLITVDTLKYLQRGGRISMPQAFIASVLNVKPILRVRDGKLMPLGRERSRSKALAHILDFMEQQVGDQEICAAIAHALSLEETEAFRQALAERFRCRELYILDDIGPVAGTHLGPGALGVGWYVVPQEECGG